LKDKEIKEVSNKYHVLRCSEILQKFQVDVAFKELPELEDLTETLDKLDQKYERKSMELINVKQKHDRLSKEFNELKSIAETKEIEAKKA